LHDDSEVAFRSATILRKELRTFESMNPELETVNKEGKITFEGF
jgi:hypothetical protein